MHRFLWKFLAKLTNVFSTQQAVRCFPRIRLWVASSKVPRKKSATRSRKTSWLEPKSRIARRLTGLWVGNVYVPTRHIDTKAAACQLCWQKASNLRQTTFRERKRRENLSQSRAKTHKKWRFLSNVQKARENRKTRHIFCQLGWQNSPEVAFRESGSVIANLVEIMGNSH